MDWVEACKLDDRATYNFVLRRTAKDNSKSTILANLILNIHVNRWQKRRHCYDSCNCCAPQPANYPDWTQTFPSIGAFCSVIVHFQPRLLGLRPPTCHLWLCTNLCLFRIEIPLSYTLWARCSLKRCRRPGTLLVEAWKKPWFIPDLFHAILLGALLYADLFTTALCELSQAKLKQKGRAEVGTNQIRRHFV